MKTKEPDMSSRRTVAAVVAVAVLVIVDLEYPRAGFIRLDSVDQILVDLRRTMDKP